MELQSLIRLVGLLALALMLFSPVVARAQFLDPSLLSFAPDPPVADRPFEMVILVIPCLTDYLSSEGATVTVANGQIEVTVEQVHVFVCPPLPTYEIVIPLPPLPAGHYDVRVLGQSIDHPGFFHPLILTSVDVVPQDLAINAPTQIPATSRAWLSLLFATLLLLGVLRTRSGT